jgi:hypothetical protein
MIALLADPVRLAIAAGADTKPATDAPIPSPFVNDALEAEEGTRTSGAVADTDDAAALESKHKRLRPDEDAGDA